MFCVASRREVAMCDVIIHHTRCAALSDRFSHASAFLDDESRFASQRA
jgi:hypothetical protein